ncbi:MAG TPA: hypothetical protein VFD97_05000 [Acidimicrobiia bacterium]|nr:hypothetical protein [Acidimicrobiia bacterium]
MLEIAIASVFIAVAFVAVSTSSRPLLSANVTEVLPASVFDEPLADLPCPWCQAQTRENDANCPSCGQPFG